MLKDAKEKLVGDFRMQLILCVFSAFLFRALVLLVSDNGIDLHFNAYDQPLFTWYDWMRSDRLVPLQGNPPMYYLLLRAVFTVFGFDPFTLPRVVALLFGAASIAPLMVIARKTFDGRAALWTGLGAVFYPLGVRLSVVSLEATVFHFFLLTSVAFLVSDDEKKPSVAPAVWSGIFCSLACASRFEGWLLIPFMALLFWRASLKKAFVFGLIASVFPILWMAASYHATGNPVDFASISAVVQGLHLQGVGTGARLAGWPMILVRTSTLPVLAIMAIGLFAAWRMKKGLVPAVLGLGLLILFEIFTLRGTMALNETKYIASVALLLMPFFGFGVEVTAYSNSRKAKIAALVVIVAIALGYSTVTVAQDNRRFSAPENVKELCRYLMDVPAARGKILLGVGYQGYILTHSELPYDRFVLVSSDDATGRRSREEFVKSLQRNAPCLVVHDLMADRLDFQEIIPIAGRKKEAVVDDFRLKTVFAASDGKWMLLEAASQPSPQ
jgi:hypothetical protein